MARRYLLIGTGVAALTAAQAIRRHDPAGEITVVGDDPHGYYSRPGLAYVLNRTIPEKQIYPLPVETLVEIFPNRIHASITRIETNRHEVLLDDGRRLGYDRLLVATGARSIKPDFPGNDLAGLVRLNTLQDVREIARVAAPRCPAIVIGGGIIAVELAEGLAARGMQVRYLLRGDRFWASVLDETESRLIERGLEEVGIRLHHKTQIARAVGKKGALQQVVTRAGESFRCQVLGSAIGLESNMELAVGAGLRTDKGIMVDEYLETSAPDVFAAGDVAQVHDPRTGGTWLETLWPVARRQGEIAGQNMAGVRIVCERQVAFNVVRIGGVTTATIGAIERGHDADLVTLSSNDRRHWGAKSDAWLVNDGYEVSRVRVVLSEQTIVGALVMGDQSMVKPLLSLIEEKADLSPIRPKLERAQRDPALSLQILAHYHQEREMQRALA